MYAGHILTSEWLASGVTGFTLVLLTDAVWRLWSPQPNGATLRQHGRFGSRRHLLSWRARHVHHGAGTCDVGTDDVAVYQWWTGYSCNADSIVHI